MPLFKCKKSKKEPSEAPYPLYEQELCSHTVLYRVPAHFLGRKAPSATFDELESVQKPLSELYSACPHDRIMAKDTPREVMLLVLASGILAIPVNPIDPPIWIRMQQFRGCGALKAIATREGFVFAPIGSKKAKKSAYPGLFTLLTQRSGCVPLLDCYAFSCVSEKSAIQLAFYTRQAFEDRRGWSDDSKPPQIDLLNMDQPTYPCNPEQQPSEFVNPELYKKPPLHGFFYAPSSDVIKTYDVGLESEVIVHEEVVEETECPFNPVIITSPSRPPPVVEVINLPQQQQQVLQLPQQQQQFEFLQLPQQQAQEQPEIIYLQQETQQPQYIIQDQMNEPTFVPYDQFLTAGGDIYGQGSNSYQPPLAVSYLTQPDDYTPQENVYTVQAASTYPRQQTNKLPTQQTQQDYDYPVVKKMNLDEWMRV